MEYILVFFVEEYNLNGSELRMIINTMNRTIDEIIKILDTKKKVKS